MTLSVKTRSTEISGIAFEETRQKRDQPVLSERHVAVDAQPSARCRARRRLALGRRHVGQDAQAAIVEGGPFRGKLQPTRRAADQPRAEPCLQPRDQFAHCRWRHAQSTRRRRKAPRFDDADEHFDLAGAVDVGSGHS